VTKRDAIGQPQGMPNGHNGAGGNQPAANPMPGGGVGSPPKGDIKGSGGR
jgi:hypothetical protein